MTIELQATTTPTGFEVHDSIEQRHLHVGTSGPVSLDPTDTDEFPFPVDTSSPIETAELRFDQHYAVTLHDSTGQAAANFDVGETATLEDGTQFVGLSAPIKLYFRIDSAGTIDIGLTSVRISLEEETTVQLGARSPHDRPVGTITTPPDIESMAEAVSMLPSALKTTSPERTWPTLRGHPPLIELGDSFDVPSEIDPPDSDVTLTVPPTYRSLYQAAPLAFFLGGTIRLGREPTLETPRFERSLTDRGGFSNEVASLLKRFFLLDCLARTEGIFQYDLLERSVLERTLPFDLETIYDEPLSARLEQYLSVPYERLEPHVPRWPLTAHVPDESEGIEVVPFVVNELGIVRESRGRSPTSVPQPNTGGAQLVRSATEYRSSSSIRSESAFVVPDVTDESVEHAWFGDSVPQKASKATIEAYRSQLDRDARNESIEILLVCNDVRMIDEHDLLDETYGNRDQLPFEIHSEFGVETDQFASLLTDGGYDFLHYIGHATEDGIRCPDGDLDVRTLESVDLGVFFLNACRSYEQGLALTRLGAFGGVGTYSDVVNEDAVEAGETIARLLNRGFPLRGALEIAQENTALGDQYLIVGDGSADIAQSDGGAPGVVELDPCPDGEYGFSVRTYSTKEYKLGTASASNLECVADRHLSPGVTPSSFVDGESIQEYLTWTELPILIDDGLHWNDGIGPAILE
ncbi:hypothetical protein EA462_12615 [Natrarchaeobius halalkaliphilus]|uniref:CHAT domain-containing protein n=1 Tax=Natrarchaeobius halalkaliphilus TaxID=1679091 RepID=A0A3N6MUW5_9EURY|nr:hypothetical protein [Natrarchaeobius halalkaliphilus]RQG89202.1 hypothetical protein EA462_12615 [Natrarchaeobius halalkaliphilus]